MFPLQIVMPKIQRWLERNRLTFCFCIKILIPSVCFALYRFQNMFTGIVHSIPVVCSCTHTPSNKNVVF